MNNSVIVYGWYGKNNIGDELFKESFRKLFPDLTFEFTDKIRVAALQNAAAVFIGGGSFLFSPPNMEIGALELLKQKKLFYIGVGVETDIHPTHKELMQYAKFIATRSIDGDVILDKINPNYKFYPDIVYALQDSVQISNKIENSVLVVPNISVVPKWDDPHWKHASWIYFKSEFAQFLDELASQKYKIGFLPMCTSPDTDDRWAAYELIAHMKNRKQTEIMLPNSYNISDVTGIWSQFQTVITQRFHGIVLSEMTQSHYLSLYHHDKLKSAIPGHGQFFSYYETSKRQLWKQFNFAQELDYSQYLPIESNNFKELVQTIMSHIKGG